MSSIIAETRNGKVRGLIQKGIRNHEFYAFKGIPYAKPPVGELRFRDPEPAESWSGVREATSYSSKCAQIDYFDNQFKGEEDCLYLNVYTKDVKFKAGRPVIVWIHAGLFYFGSSDDYFYGPEYFMQKDIVFVTFNYRLGVFGFLNLHDEEACGNQGLKDQVMVLKWIHDNIANFGGDPNNVTISGISSGSACAHYITISPLTKGLFHKAIFQSGVVFNSWTFDANPKERAYNLCEFLGHSGKDAKSIITFLRTINAQKLAVAQEKMRHEDDYLRFTNYFVPSIDRKSKKAFMPVHPEVAGAKGVQVPLIIGHTNREANFYRKDLVEAIARIDKNIDIIFHPRELQNMKKIYNLNPQILKRIYFQDNSVTKKNLESLIDLYGEWHIVEGIHRAIRLQVEKSCSPTYYYQFSYSKKVSSTGILIDTGGAGHVQELPYLFRMQYFSSRLGNVDNDPVACRISEQMIDLWVEFAKTGISTPNKSDLVPLHWPPVNSTTNFCYLDIGESLRVDTKLSLQQKYGVHKNCKHKL